MGSSSSCPPTIAYLACQNLGFKPQKGDTLEAATANNQTIADNTLPKVKEYFVQEFKYDPPAVPLNIYNDGSSVPELKASNSETYWYKKNDPCDDERVRDLAKAAVNGLGVSDLFPSDYLTDMEGAIIREIQNLFNHTVAVWVKDTDTFNGPVIVDPDTGKRIRGRIHLAYYAYHGETADKLDGVYVVMKTTSYIAKFSYGR